MANKTVCTIPSWLLHHLLPRFPFMVDYNCKLLVAFDHSVLPQPIEIKPGHHFTKKYKLKNIHFLLLEIGLKGEGVDRVPQLNFHTSFSLHSKTHAGVHIYTVWCIHYGP